VRKILIVIFVAIIVAVAYNARDMIAGYKLGKVSTNCEAEAGSERLDVLNKYFLSKCVGAIKSKIEKAESDKEKINYLKLLKHVKTPESIKFVENIYDGTKSEAIKLQCACVLASNRIAKGKEILEREFLSGKAKREDRLDALHGLLDLGHGETVIKKLEEDALGGNKESRRDLFSLTESYLLSREGQGENKKYYEYINKKQAWIGADGKAKIEISEQEWQETLKFVIDYWDKNKENMCELGTMIN
jgi:hypothetical protein